MGKTKKIKRSCILGIKIKIKKQYLPKKYQKFNLVKTKDGVSDTVYLLDNIYVLKIFDSATQQQIYNEQILLKTIKNLKVPKIVDIFKIEKKHAVIYTQIEGKSIKTPTLKDIKQIGSFLKQFHKKSKNLKSSNKKSKNLNHQIKKYLKKSI